MTSDVLISGVLHFVPSYSQLQPLIHHSRQKPLDLTSAEAILSGAAPTFPMAVSATRERM